MTGEKKQEVVALLTVAEACSSKLVICHRCRDAVKKAKELILLAEVTEEETPADELQKRIEELRARADRAEKAEQENAALYDAEKLMVKAAESAQKSAEAEVARLTEVFAYIRDGYSPVHSRGCPACVYEEGRFVRHCKIHEEWAATEAEVARLVAVLTAIEKRAGEAAGYEVEGVLYDVKEVARKALEAKAEED